MGTVIAKRAGGRLDLPGFTVTPVSISPVGKPSFDQWREAVHWSNRCAQASMFWLGDLLRFGELTYGDLASQEDGDGKYSYQTLANAKWVSEKIPVLCRRENLTFEHHKLVARLPEREQKSFLLQAEQEGWTIAELRNAIRAEKGEEESGLWRIKCVRAIDTLDEKLEQAGRITRPVRLALQTIRDAIDD